MRRTKYSYKGKTRGRSLKYRRPSKAYQMIRRRRIMRGRRTKPTKYARRMVQPDKSVYFKRLNTDSTLTMTATNKLASWATIKATFTNYAKVTQIAMPAQGTGMSERVQDRIFLKGFRVQTHCETGWYNELYAKPFILHWALIQSKDTSFTTSNLTLAGPFSSTSGDYLNLTLAVARDAAKSNLASRDGHIICHKRIIVDPTKPGSLVPTYSKYRNYYIPINKYVKFSDITGTSLENNFFIAHWIAPYVADNTVASESPVGAGTAAMIWNMYTTVLYSD